MTNSFIGSFMLKLRPLDPADTGWLGLTVYGGANAGFFQTGTTNDAGTAWRNSVQLGAIGGLLGQVLLTDMIEVMLFVGGRATLFGALEEEGDPQSSEFTAVVTPDFGGNITAHLPGGFDLSLGSVINFFNGDDDEKGSARTFVLGLSWSPGGVVAPMLDTSMQEATP